jgi:hypothetical protein
VPTHLFPWTRPRVRPSLKGKRLALKGKGLTSPLSRNGRGRRVRLPLGLPATFSGKGFRPNLGKAQRPRKGSVSIWERVQSRSGKGSAPEKGFRPQSGKGSAPEKGFRPNLRSEPRKGLGALLSPPLQVT